jgi:hypothetical protein
MWVKADVKWETGRSEGGSEKVSMFTRWNEEEADAPHRGVGSGQWWVMGWEVGRVGRGKGQKTF